MPRYLVNIQRTYAVIEGVDRVIEAVDKNAAINLARQLCGDYDENCPDDCSEICDAGAGDFYVGDVGPYEGGRATDVPEVAE